LDPPDLAIGANAPTTVARDASDQRSVMQHALGALASMECGGAPPAHKGSRNMPTLAPSRTSLHTLAIFTP